MDKISVIIPTYNRENTIRRAVESVLAQTYQNIEVIVVDDGSIDDTKAVMEQIIDDKVKYVALEKNGGVANARNVGVSLATGEWIAFQDSDDKWYPDKLQKQLEYANGHPEFDMIYGFYLAKLEDGSTRSVPAEPLPEKMEGWMRETLLERNVIGAPTILMKKKCFLESGGFDVSYKSLEDWEYVLRFSGEHQIGCVRESLMDVYMLQGGVSSRMGDYFESRCRLLATYKREIVECGLLETVVLNILNRAKMAGVLESVNKMLQLYLQ